MGNDTTLATAMRTLARLLALAALLSAGEARELPAQVRASVLAHADTHSASVVRMEARAIPRAAMIPWTAQNRGPMRPWLKWGLVGAGVGAVTFPLLGSMASDSRQNAARDVVAGAAAGFIIVGGGVALWHSLCGPDSSSRRAGLCGH